MSSCPALFLHCEIALKKNFKKNCVYCVLLLCIVLLHIALCCTALCCAAFCRTQLYVAEYCGTVLPRHVFLHAVLSNDLLQSVLCCVLLHCVVQCCILFHCVVFCRTALCCVGRAVFCRTMSSCALLHCCDMHDLSHFVMLFWNVLFSVAPLCRTTLRCTALCYVLLHCCSSVFCCIARRSVKTVPTSHAIFSLLKIPILSYKPLRMGVQTKHKQCNKTLLFWGCKSNLRHKHNYCLTDVTFIRSIPVLHAKNSVATLFFSSRLYPQKGFETYDLRF